MKIVCLLIYWQITKVVIAPTWR